jgi:hypothetical protein
MEFDEKRSVDELKKKMISTENELTQAGVFNEKKTRSYEDLEKERLLLLKFLNLQSQYIKKLFYKLKKD